MDLTGLFDLALGALFDGDSIDGDLIDGGSIDSGSIDGGSNPGLEAKAVLVSIEDV